MTLTHQRKKPCMSHCHCRYGGHFPRVWANFCGPRPARMPLYLRGFPCLTPHRTSAGDVHAVLVRQLSVDLVASELAAVAAGQTVPRAASLARCVLTRKKFRMLKRSGLPVVSVNTLVKSFSGQTIQLTDSERRLGDFFDLGSIGLIKEWSKLSC